MREFDSIVVGGGAAGLLCAGAAAACGKLVTVLEKMPRPARKILVTGKGRCNLTNNCGGDELLRAVRSNGRFLHSAFSAFSPADTMTLFERLGVPLKTERGNRVFPVSDRAMDIADALVRYAKQNGAIIQQKTVESLWIVDGTLCGVVCVGGEQISGETVIIATGGLSYPGTGSTGDGYHLAEQAGHTVKPLRPSLIPVVTKEDWCADIMGLSLRNITLTVTQKDVKKPVFHEQGELLFTHFGVSGPLVLSASAHMDGELSEYTMQIDLKPALDEATLDARILRDFAESKNRAFRNSLGNLLPSSLVPVIVSLSGIHPDEKVNQITKEGRRKLIHVMKALTLHPKAFRPIEEAVITSGGIAVNEINPKTMQSKLLASLFFAGEVLDVDAYTGGFNLQIAFSTGYAAGIGSSCVN